MKKLLIKQIRSATGRKENQRLYLKSLGLRRIGQTVERVDNHINRRLVSKLCHMVRVVGEKQIVEGKNDKTK